MPLDGEYHGKNFAPIAPLTDAKRSAKNGGASSLSAIFREIYQEIENQDKEAWRQQIEMGRIISNFRAGELIMKRDLRGDGIVFLKPLGERQDRSNYPVFPQISEDLKSKWMKAQPTVEARHFGDGYKTEIQLKSVNAVVASYFKNFFTPFYEANEALSAQDFGTYITRVFYDQTLNRLQALAPVLQNQSKVLVGGYGGCYDCSFEGEPADFKKTEAAFPQCPECKSFRTTKMLDPTVVNQLTPVGVQEINQGDLAADLLPFPACKYDTHVLPQDSSFFRLKTRVAKRIATAICGDFELAGIRGGDDDFGLNVIDDLAARGAGEHSLGAGGHGLSSRLGDDPVYIELWLKPEWYRGIRLSQSEKTVGGTIPKDVPLEKIFPDGVCVTGFNELNLQTGVYAEKPSIVGGVYFVQSFSGLGKGMSDGIGLAKDLNEMHSMAMAGIKRYGAAGVYFDKNAVTQTQMRDLFNPRKAVPLDLQKAGLADIRQAVGQVQFAPVNQILPQYAIQLSNLLNLVSLSGDFSEGAVQSVDINTLGGQQLATAKEEGKKGAILSMKVFHRQKCAEKICELFRLHIKIPKFFAASDDRNAATKGKLLQGADLPENIKFDAVADSELPANAFEKRNAAKEMIQSAGGIGNLLLVAQQDPKMAQWFAEQYGATLPMLNQQDIWLDCLARVDSIKQLSQIYGDPKEVLSQMRKPVLMREYGHQLKAEFIGQLLDDDEVLTWNPVALRAVQMLVEVHLDMAVQAQMADELRKQQAQATVQAKAQAMQQQIAQPQIDAQNAQIQQQQQAQAQQAAQDKQDALLGEVVNRSADEESKQVDYERSLQTKEADHARAMEMAQFNAKNAPKQLKGK